MRKLIILIAIFSIAKSLRSQHFCELTGVKHDSIHVKALSFEKDTLDGEISIDFCIYALDTIILKTDIHLLDSENRFSLSSYYNFGISNDTLLAKGDSLLITVNVNYDVDSLPYTYKTLRFLFNNEKYEAVVNVYFTPYNTLEVWNLGDFYSLLRVWLTNSDSSKHRTFVHKDSIPISDVPVYSDVEQELDSNVEVRLRFVKGLGYAIPMIDIDTFNFDGGTYYSVKRADDCGALWHRYIGRINNIRLTANHLNDRNVTVPIGLKNVTVEILVDRWPGSKVAEVRTDDEGYIVDGNNNRSFTFDFCTKLTKNNIDVYLNVKLHDPDDKNRFRVKYHGTSKKYYEFIAETFNMTYNDGDEQTLNLGTFISSTERRVGTPPEALGVIYTILKFSHDYSINAISGSGRSVPDFQARIYSSGQRVCGAIQEREWAFFGKNCNYVYIGQNFINRAESEFVLSHEYGHFFTFNISSEGLLSWPNGGKTHSSNFNNENMDLTMAEGLANGFSMIMDLMTHSKFDNESGAGWIEDYHLRKQINNSLNTPFLSEEILGKIMLDMWDGPSNLSKFSNSIPVTDYNDNNIDHFEISFFKIFEPLWEGSMSDLNTYFLFINNDLNCLQSKELRRIWDYNFSLFTSGIDPTTFRILTADGIGHSINLSLTGIMLNDDWRPINTNNFNFSPFGNVEVLNNTVFNHSIIDDSPDIFPKDIADDLDIINYGTLEFNVEGLSRFKWNMGISTLSNSTFNTNVCSDLIDAQANSNIVIGDPSGSTSSIVHLLESGTLSLSSNSSTTPSTLTINNNSKLIIEEGAILQFHSGAKIILNGPEAILEIKGQIQIMDGATFTFTGGDDGLGYIKFFKNANSGPIALISSPNNDGKVELIGTSSSDKLIEIDGTEGLKLNSDIIDFTIKQAKILLGDRSTIEPNVSGKVFFESVKIDQLFNDYEHNGIRINGVKNEFHLVTVTGGNYGFINTGLIIGNEKLNLRAVHIVECSIGIMTYSSGINYLGGLIKGYSIAGWKSVGANVPSDITGVWFNNDQSNSGVFGVLLDGVNSAGSSTFTGSKFQSNASGIQAWNVPVRLKSCNYFEANDIGIQMEAWSNLDLSNNSYTTFNGNDIHILSRFHGIMHMNDGHNGFLSSGNSSIFWASLQPGAQSPSVTYLTLAPTPENYYANNNFFQTTPSWGNNFYLDERGSRVLNLTTNNFYPNNNPSVWTSAQNNVCGTPDYETLEFTFNGGGLGQFNVSKYSTLSGVTIPSGLEYGNNLLNVCSGLLDSLYMGYAPNYSSITCGLGHLARKTFSNNSPIMANLKLELLDHAIKAYAIGVSKNAIFVREDSLSFASNCLLGTIDTLLIDANNDSLPWKNVKFNLSAAKAEVLRIAEHRDDASMYLNSALNIYTDSLEQIYLNKWSCIIEAEQAFIDSLVTLDSIYINYPCYGQEIEFSAPMPNTTEIDIPTKKKEELKNSMFVYPNPASDLLKVVLNNKQEIVKIVICDLKGMVLYSSEISAQNSETEIDLSAFSSGSYVISVMSDQAVFHSPLIISK